MTFQRRGRLLLRTQESFSLHHSASSLLTSASVLNSSWSGKRSSSCKGLLLPSFKVSFIHQKKSKEKIFAFSMGLRFFRSQLVFGCSLLSLLDMPKYILGTCGDKELHFYFQCIALSFSPCSKECKALVFSNMQMIYIQLQIFKFALQENILVVVSELCNSAYTACQNHKLYLLTFRLMPLAAKQSPSEL